MVAMVDKEIINRKMTIIAVIGYHLSIRILL